MFKSVWRHRFFSFILASPIIECWSIGHDNLTSMISVSSLFMNHKTTFSAFAGWDRCGRRWSDQLWRVLHHDVHKVLRGHKGLQGKVRSGEASRSAKQSLFHLNTLQCPGYVLHSMKWTYLCIHKVRANPQQTSLFGDADVEDFVLKNSLGWKHGWTFDLLR